MEESKMKTATKYPDTTYVQGQNETQKALNDLAPLYMKWDSMLQDFTDGTMSRDELIGEILAVQGQEISSQYEDYKGWLAIAIKQWSVDCGILIPIEDVATLQRAIIKELPKPDQFIEPNKMVSDEETIFNEARLTHPMTGFKHKDFQEFQSWKQKQDGWPDNIENKAK